MSALSKIASYVGRLSRARLIQLSIVLGTILFLAVNVIASQTLRSARFDLTENALYSLSDGTKGLLAELEEPIHLRLFLSDDLVRTAPQLASYADRVRSMVEAYAGLAGGTITLEIIDPEPFSAEEDRAVGLGIERLRLTTGSDALFFGLAATNSTDGRALIPVFSPSREPFLEYDLTRLIAEVGQPVKPRLALIDGIGLSASPTNPTGDQQILTLLRELYEIDVLSGDVDDFAEGTRVVLLAHPVGLSDRTLYALDQWVLGGGALLAFVDPVAETLTAQQPGRPPGAEASSSLDRLFEAWGVAFDAEKAVADPAYAIRTVRQIGRREVEVSNPAWLSLSATAMDQGDAALSQLSSLIFTTAGAFSPTGDLATLKPLLQGSEAAGLVSASEASDPFGDPRKVYANLEALETAPILAARVEGSFESAFPDGKPNGSEAPAEHVSELAVAANVILVSDADMLMDRNWIQEQQLFGQSFAQAFANNGDFVLNAVEQMAGGAALADLRGRAVAFRPFELIEAIERSAEARYLETEQALLQRIQEVEGQLRDAAPTEPEEGGLVSAESLAAVDELRADLLAARAELRDVQFQLRRDVERIETGITALLVGLVPVLVTAVTLLVAFRRPRRSVPTV